MFESPLPLLHGLYRALEDLDALVSANPVQPLNQFAENAVLHWLRVVENKDFLIPRLNADGLVPGVFHFSMERELSNRMERGIPTGDGAAYRAALETRLKDIAGKLERYFTQEAYRNSSEHCDQIMVELSRVSRFLATCCLDGERLAPDPLGQAAPEGRPAGEGGSPHRDFLLEVRGNLFTWEPLLNDAIVAWNQNALHEFDRALEKLRRVLALSPPERAAYVAPPGYPLRPQGRPRLKVSVVEPPQRPLRTKSFFSVRLRQLVRRLDEGGDWPASLILELEADMGHFVDMVVANRFLLASEPGFWDAHRQGMPVIRGRQTSHPFLLDPMDFFKKAVLFHNRTYTLAGGGLERMYLQMRQLRRFYRFPSSRGPRSRRLLIEKCLMGWEENRWGAFTGGLLALAEDIRKEAGKSSD